MGSFWNPTARLPSLKMGLYSGDLGADRLTANELSVLPSYFQTPLGVLNMAEILSSYKTNSLFAWENLNTRILTRSQLIDLVNEGQYWGIVYYGEQLSNNLTTYFFSNPTIISAEVEIIYDEGRSAGSASLYLPVLQSALETQTKTMLNTIFTSAKGSTAFRNAIDNRIYIEGFRTKKTNIHPVDYRFGENSASYIAPLILWMGSMISVMLIHRYYTANVGAGKTYGKVDVEANEELLNKSSSSSTFPSAKNALSPLFLIVLFAAIHSAVITIVMVSFGVDSAYNMGNVFGWLFYSSICFHAMNFMLSVVIGAQEFPAVSSLLLILFVTSSQTIVSHELQNQFYLVGKGLPFNYVVQGMRLYLFGSLRVTLAEGALVIFGWTVGSMVVTWAFSALKIGHLQKGPVAQVLRDLSGTGAALRNGYMY